MGLQGLQCLTDMRQVAFLTAATAGFSVNAGLTLFCFVVAATREAYGGAKVPRMSFLPTESAIQSRHGWVPCAGTDRAVHDRSGRFESLGKRG